MAISVTARTDLISIVVGMFNAAPGAKVLSDLTVAFEANQTRLQIATNLARSAEYLGIYPEFLTNAEFATKLVDNMVGSLVSSAAKADAVTLLTGLLNAKNTNTPALKAAARAEVTLYALDALKAVPTTDATLGNAVTALNNKVEVAVFYSVDKQQNPASLSAGQDVIKNVTNTAASVTAAKDSISGTAAVGQTFTLTTGIDPIGSFTGGAGNDTFTGNTSAGALTFTSLDAIDGGAGTDTLSIAATVAVDTTGAVGASVKNIENVTITSTGAVTANTTDWTGVTSLTTASTGNSTITTATTTDVTSTVTSPTGAGAAAINGGKAVTLTLTDSAIAGTGSGNTIAIGGTTAPTGAVTVTQTETITDAAGLSASATGTVSVTGGTTVTVNSLASVGTGDNAGDIITIGGVTVQGNASTTSVSVTQSAATAAWAAAGNKIKITNGAVTITDLNTATKADSITSVTLNHFGNSTITGNALTTLNLTGGSAAATASGTLGISQSAGLTTSAPTELTINMASGRVGAITDTNNQYKTLNVVSAAAATIADLDFSSATALAVSGAGVTTISALTDLAAATSITSSGGGLTLTPAIGTGVAFTGGAGKESISIGATTKAITTGAGDDNVTIGATALGSGGSVDAGEGTDTLTMSDANAVTASAGTTFEGTISGFERLSVTGATNAAQEIKLNNLDDINYVSIQGVAAGQTLTLSGASTGVTLVANAGAAGTAAVSLANNGSADELNVNISQSAAQTIAGLTATGFETINFATDDTAATPTGIAHIVTTLTNADATTINVTGDAGLTITTFAGTKLTNFNAAGVTKGAVSYTTGALAGAATLTGGAGADTLNAAAAVASVTINGGDGADTITGSSTKASTLNGGGGNDTITGGSAADVIDGGAGTDTFVANLTEQAGASTTDGAVINLSDTALTQSGVFSVTGKYLTSAAPTVASNTATYLYSSESTTNADIVDTLISIENVTGTTGADYIVGSSAANFITGGAGIDYLTGGAGVDSFLLNSTNTADRDIITDFAAGAGGDKLVIDISDFALAGGDVYVGALGALAVDSSKEIVVLTGTGYANKAAAETALAGQVTTNGLDVVVAYFDTTANKGYIVYDADAGVDGGDAMVLVGVLNNITTQTAFDALVAANFASQA